VSGGLPRLARWLLERRLAADWREFILGDLEEEFHARRAVSPAAARRWLWRQTVRCLAAPPRPASLLPTDSVAIEGDPMFRTLLSDLRYAVRVLFRAPGFAFSVVAVFALGIGVNTAIFSIVNAVLLRPLPFDQPDRLVRIFHVPPQSTFPGMKTFPVSPANFYDWKREAHLFEGMAIYRFRQFTLTGGNTAESVVAGAVGADFFQIVRATPALGRVFLPEEDTPARKHVVVLSDRFWKSHFGGARDAIDRTMTLDGEPYTIVGIMPPRFSARAWGASGRDIWVPLAYDDKAKAVRENHNAQVVARLKDGVDVAQAEAEMRLISSRLEQAYPQANAGWSATIITLQELIVGDIRSSLLMLLAAVGLVLLIACANVGNLLFTRALGRRKEMAIRAALGAGRGRVFQQLLVEALLLGAAGGAAGLLLARAGLALTATFLAAQLPRADEISLDARVLLFVAGASIAAAVLAGALPGLRVGAADFNDALKEGGRNDGAVGLRTRRLLIVCEVALSLVLLMGAGLMVRTLIALGRVDAGFDPRNVLTLHVELPQTRYATPDKITTFFDTALQRIRALPGVESAAATDDLPLAGGSQQPMVVDGRAELLPRDQPTVAVRKITPAYLKTLRVPLLEGRDVAENDVDVMLVSRAAARLLWGDTDPIGHQATLPLESKTRTLQVIGMVGDIRDNGLADAPVATVYEFTREHAWNNLSFVVRTAVPPAALASAAANAVRALDPEQPVEDIRPLTAVVDDTLAARRFSAMLLGLFASVALVLATVGIYSVLSYIVRGRRHEIGIRTALGAGTRDVVRMVVLEGMTPTAVGIAAGAAIALAAGTALRKLVFGVSASDPITLIAVAGTLLIVALIGCLVPAYRASRLDPLTVLRAD
jgi:predicted permease